MQIRAARLALVLVVLALGSTALPVDGQVCANIPKTVTLHVNATPVGTVTVSNDLNKLYITYMVLPGYVIDQTNLQVAATLAGIPVSSSGEPQTSKFTYRTTNQPGVTSFTYTIPRNTPPNTTIYIAANAIVQQVSTSCGGGEDHGDDHHEGDDDHHDGDSHHSSSASSNRNSSSGSHDSHESDSDVRQTACGGGSSEGDDEDGHKSSASSSNHSSGGDHHDDGDEGHHSSQCCGPQMSAWAGDKPFPGSKKGATYFTYVVNCGIPE